jgi:hypothetical protein
MKKHLKEAAAVILMAASLSSCALLFDDPQSAKDRATALATIDHLGHTGRITPDQHDELRKALLEDTSPGWLNQVLSVAAGIGLALVGLRVKAPKAQPLAELALVEGRAARASWAFRAGGGLRIECVGSRLRAIAPIPSRPRTYT